MVYVYLSDESIDVAKSNEAPRIGEHLGSWVPVLTEVHRFRTITECNQIAIPVAITDVLSLGAILSHLKENTLTNPQVSRILFAIKEQLGTIKVVEIPPPDEEETTFRHSFKITPGDVGELTIADLFEEEE